MQGIFDGLKWRYTWDDDMFAKAGGGNLPIFGKFLTRGSGDVTWCWIIWIKCMERLICGESPGEALVLRAWYYFQLVNLYGFPYNYGDPNRILEYL